jgi:hypothetical protein
MTIVRGMITIELSELIPSPIGFGTIEHLNQSWRYHRRILPLPTSPGVGLRADKISYHIATAGLYHVYHCTIVSNIKSRIRYKHVSPSRVQRGWLMQSATLDDEKLLRKGWVTNSTCSEIK